jgi:hypothetical protein
MRSTDRLGRFTAWLRILNEDPGIDPLKSLMRAGVLARFRRQNMMREDQLLAAKLALAGPWGHVPDALLTLSVKHETRPELTRRLGLPAWQGRFTTAFQTTQLWRVVSAAGLPAPDRWRAHAAVLSHHVGWHRRRVVDHFRRASGSMSRRHDDEMVFGPG